MTYEEARFFFEQLCLVTDLVTDLINLYPHFYGPICRVAAVSIFDT
jgi:hypothetical protein